MHVFLEKRRKRAHSMARKGVVRQKSCNKCCSNRNCQCSCRENPGGAAQISYTSWRLWCYQLSSARLFSPTVAEDGRHFWRIRREYKLEYTMHSFLCTLVWLLTLLCFDEWVFSSWSTKLSSLLLQNTSPPSSDKFQQSLKRTMHA